MKIHTFLLKGEREEHLKSKSGITYHFFTNMNIHKINVNQAHSDITPN